MVKKRGVAQLKKEADKYWSVYVRLRDSDTYGFAQCITCSTRKPWKEHQNGHFISRGASALRYNELNCNAQCVSCNMFKQGNQYQYSINLDLKYGRGTAAQLHAKRMETHKFTISELESIISYAKEYIAHHS